MEYFYGLNIAGLVSNMLTAIIRGEKIERGAIDYIDNNAATLRRVKRELNGGMSIFVNYIRLVGCSPENYDAIGKELYLVKKIRHNPQNGCHNKLSGSSSDRFKVAMSFEPIERGSGIEESIQYHFFPVEPKDVRSCNPIPSLEKYYYQGKNLLYESRGRLVPGNISCLDSSITKMLCEPTYKNVQNFLVVISGDRK